MASSRLHNVWQHALLRRLRRGEDDLLYVSVLLRQPTSWPWHLLLILSAIVIAFGHTGIPESPGNAWFRKYQLGIAVIAAAGLAIRTVVALWLHERTFTWIAYMLLVVLAFLIGPHLVSLFAAF